jgi:hypothetical protein
MKGIKLDFYDKRDNGALKEYTTTTTVDDVTTKNY